MKDNNQTGGTMSDLAQERRRQGSLNAVPGPRTVPARVIAVPETMDVATSALVSAPYSPFWNLEAPDGRAWQAIIDQANVMSRPLTAQLRQALGVEIEPVTLGGISALTLTPRNIPAAHRDHLIFHLHGGGYVFGGGEAGTSEAALMAAIGGYKVVTIDYRMPPAAPFPAAIDDVITAWKAVIETVDPRLIGVEGTSAGGGLTLALALIARDQGVPLPAAIAPGSPAADLTVSGDTIKTNEWIDNIIVTAAGYASQALDLYAGNHDRTDPRMSPLHGHYEGLCPAILTSGTRDLFLSDTVRVHRKLRQAGVTAELHVYEGLSHAQYVFDPTLNISREVFGEITQFFDRYLGKGATAVDPGRKEL